MPTHTLKLMNDSNRDYYRAELERFKVTMEQLSGNEITDERLTNSIALHNETRSLFRELYDLKRKDDPGITAEEALEIVLASSLLPKDRANPLLRKLLGEVRARETAERFGPRLPPFNGNP